MRAERVAARAALAASACVHVARGVRPGVGCL